MAKAKTKTKPRQQIEGPKEKNALQVLLQPEGGQELSFQEAVGQLHEAVIFLAEQTFKLNLSVGYNPALGTKGSTQFCLDMAHAGLLSARRELEHFGCHES